MDNESIGKDRKNMRFYIDSKELNAGILSVIKALPTRSTMPILEGIYVEALSTGVKLKCSDLMLQKECILPATVEEEGRAIVPGKLFSEIVRKLPEAIAEVNLLDKAIHISCGRAKSAIQCIDYDDFPDMRFSGETFALTMDPRECRDMIMETVFATSQDESRPILTGALLEISDRINIVATDSYQFAMRSCPLKEEVSPREMIIPGKSLLEIARMMDETEETVEMTFTKTHVKVQLNSACLIARLLEGDYIKYKQILPEEYKTRALINRLELIESIDRAQLMAREGNNNIVMCFHENKLIITANSFVGTINEEMDVTIIGEDLDIAFNPRFCMNILKCIPDENIYMDFVTAISPAVVRPVQGDQYFYLIVPVRIYSQF